MKIVFKRVVSALLCLCVLLLGTLTPANANADGLNGVGSSSTDSFSRIDVRGGHNEFTVNNSRIDEYYGSQGAAPGFIESMADGAIYTIGFAVGATVVCYGADAIATAFFPPAAVLAASCPGVGAAAGGGGTVVQGIRALAK
jgi:hypothetical protein